MTSADELKFGTYAYGFSDDQESIASTGIGINEDVVRQISAFKEEPEWMLEFRLKSLRAFELMKNPKFGPSLKDLDFDSYTYFNRVVKDEARSWTMFGHD